MCTDCGCGLTDGNRHLVAHDHDHAHGHAYRPRHGHHEDGGTINALTEHNDRHARANRAAFDRHRVLVINLMSSPGSGKTSLLEATIRALKGALRIAVIEGDLETENDADRIRALGVPAYQITTGTACHLDAHLVEHALAHLDLASLDILFIENVGNLVCPADFDLGEAHKVVVLSVTEGEDKPLKYANLFAAAGLLLLNKMDLLPYVDFDVARCLDYARRVNRDIQILPLSARTGEGLDAWLDWLRQGQRAALRQQVERLETELAAARARLTGSG